jgi:hypothetical protein
LSLLADKVLKMSATTEKMKKKPTPEVLIVEETIKENINNKRKMGLFDFLTQEIAIDLGTANTLIIHNDKVVVDEPSIVAIDRMTGKVLAVGKAGNDDAWKNT